MSLLDDARQIQHGGAIDVNGRCYFCGHDLADDDPHVPDCPWLSMPRIIAVLERYEHHERGTRQMLRILCERFGDNDWSDDLHFADVIEKHLVRPMNARIMELEREQR